MGAPGRVRRGSGKLCVQRGRHAVSLAISGSQMCHRTYKTGARFVSRGLSEPQARHCELGRLRSRAAMYAQGTVSADPILAVRPGKYGDPCWRAAVKAAASGKFARYIQEEGVEVPRVGARVPCSLS